jgi:peptide deformylase
MTSSASISPDSNETPPEAPRQQRSLRLWNDPLVRPPICASASLLPDAFRAELVEDLMYWCALAKGVGLAAPQLGVASRVFVAKIAGKLKVFYDPQIVEMSKEALRGREGCLSLPGSDCYVNRAATVDMTFVDEEGKSMLGQFKGTEARIVAHEHDHLNSLLIVDHCSSLVAQTVVKKAQRFLLKQAQRVNNEITNKRLSEIQHSGRRNSLAQRKAKTP